MINPIDFFKNYNTIKNLKISSKDKINLLEQLSNLLSSGIPLINCFKIINYQTRNKKIKIIIEKIIETLNK
ncbi:MAG: hypothetical protein P1U46_04110 [Patescibacteria group bacterium]|nr:hypothetical protein [Patescibacteria group bacterium]